MIYKTPYVQQFSLDMQQAITPTMTLDVGYFGDHGDPSAGRGRHQRSAAGSVRQHQHRLCPAGGLQPPLPSRTAKAR